MKLFCPLVHFYHIEELATKTDLNYSCFVLIKLNFELTGFCAEVFFSTCAPTKFVVSGSHLLFALRMVPGTMETVNS
jgi:hypothetical protein